MYQQQDLLSLVVVKLYMFCNPAGTTLGCEIQHMNIVIMATKLFFLKPFNSNIVNSNTVSARHTVSAALVGL